MRLSFLVCLVLLSSVVANDPPKGQQKLDPDLQPEKDAELQFAVDDPIAIWNFCVEKQQDAPDAQFCTKASAGQIKALEAAKSAVNKKLSAKEKSAAVRAADRARFHMIFGKTLKQGPKKSVLLDIHEQIEQDGRYFRTKKLPQSDLSLVALEAAVEAAGIGITDLWPAATVPYKADAGLVPKTVAIMDRALDNIMEKTCIAFVEQKTETKFLTIQRAAPTATTSSADGLGSQATKISLHSSQLDLDTIMHEVGHALGLMHEHQRPDVHTNPEIEFAKDNPEPDCGWKGPSTAPTSMEDWGAAYQYLTKGTLIAFAHAHEPAVEPILQSKLTGAASKGAYNKNSVMHYYWDACMDTTMTDKGNPGEAGWTDGDSSAINDLYGCIKTKITLNGHETVVHTHPDQKYSAFKQRVFKLIKKVAPRHIKLKKGTKLLVGNNKKMSDLGVTDNTKLDFAFEVLKLTYNGNTYHIPFKFRTTLFFSLQSVIEDITKVKVADQIIKKQTDTVTLGATSQDKTKSMSQLGITKDTTLTMTKK